MIEGTFVGERNRDRRVVVIGSGFGGMASAIRLQAAGHEVTLIEAREQLGGRASQLREAGYTFDMGPSLITAPDLLRELWHSAGSDFDSEIARAHNYNPFTEIRMSQKPVN